MTDAVPDRGRPSDPGVAAVVRPIADAAGPHVPPLLGRVERRLRELAAERPEPLGIAGTDVVAAGGKRLRPLLALVAAGPSAAQDGPVADAAVRAGVAVELVHTATLVHDDVLDDAALRRGRPTTYARDGRAAATSLGDALFSAAFAELAAGGDAAAVAALATASRELAQGELLQREDAWSADVTVERYLLRSERKTGALFEAAARLGAVAAGEEDGGLGRFASGVGVAFQLMDDVLDVTAGPEVTGKPRGSDLLDGTATLPLLVGRGRDPELRDLDVRTVTTPERAAAVCDRIAACGAAAATEERARAIVRDALAALPADLDAPRRQAFALVGRGVVQRAL